tara:strand:+ start:69 stop:392 length:324 start_codon:yes stop_codon:yes gene_type:complete
MKNIRPKPYKFNYFPERFNPMKGNSPDTNQSSIVMPSLKEQMDPNHPIYQLNDRIDWSTINKDFKELCCYTGRPAKSVRLMASLLLLKQLGGFYGCEDYSLISGKKE